MAVHEWDLFSYSFFCPLLCHESSFIRRLPNANDVSFRPYFPFRHSTESTHKPFVLYSSIKFRVFSPDGVFHYRSQLNICCDLQYQYKSALYDFVLCFYTLHLIGHYSVLKILSHFHAHIYTISNTSMSILPTTSATLFCCLNLLLRVGAILLFILFIFRQKFPRNDHRWYSPDGKVNSIEYHEYR